MKFGWARVSSILENGANGKNGANGGGFIGLLEFSYIGENALKHLMLYAQGFEKLVRINVSGAGGFFALGQCLKCLKLPTLGRRTRHQKACIAPVNRYADALRVKHRESHAGGSQP